MPASKEYLKQWHAIQRAKTTYTLQEIQRFEKKFIKAGVDECWEWQRVKDKDGYGDHRLSYRIYKGPIPQGLHVCHSCDNPGCVNPKHLWLGTAKQNVHDMYAKGRQNPASGEKHGSRTKPESRAKGDKNGSRTKPESLPRGEGHVHHKLTEDDVKTMRRRYQNGELQKTLIEEYGVCASVVCNIVRRVTWRHVV